MFAERYHDISCGHRVAGHESKCAALHGHNYRIHFRCEAAKLDEIGRVIDFSVIKARLCMWVENNWDHRFLAWEADPVLRAVDAMVRDATGSMGDLFDLLSMSIVWTPFNPTAENMVDFLLRVVGPQELRGTGVVLTQVRIEETRKCSAGEEL